MQYEEKKTALLKIFYIKNSIRIVLFMMAVIVFYDETLNHDWLKGQKGINAIELIQDNKDA